MITERARAADPQIASRITTYTREVGGEVDRVRRPRCHESELENREDEGDDDVSQREHEGGQDRDHREEEDVDGERSSRR